MAYAILLAGALTGGPLALLGDRLTISELATDCRRSGRARSWPTKSTRHSAGSSPRAPA